MPLTLISGSWGRTALHLGEQSRERLQRTGIVLAATFVRKRLTEAHRPNVPGKRRRMRGGVFATWKAQLITGSCRPSESCWLLLGGRLCKCQKWLGNYCIFVIFHRQCIPLRVLDPHKQLIIVPETITMVIIIPLSKTLLMQRCRIGLKAHYYEFHYWLILNILKQPLPDLSLLWENNSRGML